ncbi:initiator tRNA phosphoribosyl transferase [Phellopilus nigrolimitatus]|nr:initiator tRNA phosphoribosyl transferase [Phellopilus nigrolimitatus]
MDELQAEAELEFSLFGDRNKLEHHALTQIRKQALDPYNRLHSIAEDIEFVGSVHEKYASYPILANLRCGAWYCDPHFSEGKFAHFKSTDGHYNGWSFNLRRPNLHILPLIHLHFVDSTRSGKRLPDSLSKTVPIWCTVINRALMLRNSIPPEGWDVQLYTPPQSVSRQEHCQIEEKLDTLGRIPFGNKTPFFPIICISASKLVEEGSERRREGYSYVQGAGDDHEYWSTGLTPDMFWKHKDELLSAPQSVFMDVLLSIVNDSRHALSASSTEWTKPPTPIKFLDGLLSISALADIPVWVLNQSNNLGLEDVATPSPCIIVRTLPKLSIKTPSDKQHHTPAASDPTSTVLELDIPNDKKSGEHAFKMCLPQCVEFIGRHVREKRSVCVACETGKDLSIGIALAAMQTLFDDDGTLDMSRRSRKHVQVSKDTLRTRLHWIIASRPEANPSRATLKRVNEFFMSSHDRVM